MQNQIRPLRLRTQRLLLVDILYLNACIRKAAIARWRPCLSFARTLFIALAVNISTLSPTWGARRYYIGERTSVNSEKQATQSVNTVLALTKEIFTTASLNLGISPAIEAKTVDRSYGGYAALGYNNGMWGLDGSFGQSISSATKLTNRTFGGGITFAYVPGMLEGEQSELDLLKAAHKQVYATEMKYDKEPLFWGRIGFNATSFRSPVLVNGGTESQSELRQLSLTVDGNTPLSRSLVISGGIAIYGYSREAAIYSEELESSATTQEGLMIARTFRGLPSLSISSDISWQVTDWDTFIPRLQGTMIVATAQWEVAGSLTWRRRIFQKLYMSPSYEMSVRGPLLISGFAVDLLYQF